MAEVDEDYFFNESTVKTCNCGQHTLKYKDALNPEVFIKSSNFKRILTYLPEVKVVSIDRYIKGIYRDLSLHCPKIECLSAKGYFDTLMPQPNVTHFSGQLESAMINKLPQVFPKLEGVEIFGQRLYQHEVKSA